MADTLSWLPALLTLDECEDDWEVFLDAARESFDADFMDDRPPFRGMRVGLKLHPPVNGENCTFWHLCSRCTSGDSCPEENREWDQVRIERIRWPRPIIEFADRHPLRIWEEQRSRGERRVHIWLVEKDYVLVLARRHNREDGDYVLPWATFVLERVSQREEYMRRYIRWS